MTEDYLEIVFAAESTSGGGPLVHSVGPKTNSSDEYAVVLRFYGVGPVLTSSFGDLDARSKEDLLRRVLEECDVRFHSDDPSFQMTGVWENLSKHDASIYKYRGPKGDGTWQSRHEDSGAGEVYLTKHLVQVLDELDDWVPYVARKVRTRGRKKANRARLRKTYDEDDISY